MAKRKIEPIRMGIVGCGRAGWGMHRNEIKEHGRKFNVVAVCDTSRSRRDEMAGEYEDCTEHKCIEDLIADPAVEMVDICTRSPEHTPHALMALKAGKLVFLEKPIALSFPEAKKLARAAARYPNKLFIRHNRRFEPGFQHVREIIDSGLLGEVYEIKLRRHNYQFRNDWQTVIKCGGGQLLNWGPHIVDHALRFLDGKVDSMWSDLRNLVCAGDAEDHVHIIMKGGTQGRVVDLEISGGVAIGEPVYIVFGSKGALTSDEKTIKLRYLNPRKKLPRNRAKVGTPPHDGGFGGEIKASWVEKEIPVKPKMRCGVNDIWRHLYAAIREDVPFPITMEQSLQVMEIIEQARRGTPFVPKVTK
jgi:scyllo-inositol 2-dehydrogenase (NADP+)